jgi:uncharacterized lipoprotein
VKRNPIFLSTVAIFAALTGLTGCSVFHQKSDYYSTAVESRPLEVPPDLDSPPNANELLVPPAAGSGASAGAQPGGAAQPAPPRPASNQLFVTDSVQGTWNKVGPAIERAKIGRTSSRDDTAHTFILDFDAALPKPEAEQHWYTAVFNHLGFGEGDPIKAHLLIRVSEEGSGSRVDVVGNASDKSAAAASLRVIQVMHEAIPGSSFPAANTPLPAPAVASAPPADVPAAASATPASAPSVASNELRVADSAHGAWTKVGPALERAKLGAISARDENAYTYAFDFDAALPKPESERHWYNHLGFGEGDPVKARLAISVVDDGGGSARINVAGSPGDRTAAAASQRVIQALHDTIPGTSLIATTAPAAPAVTSALPPASTASAPPAAPPAMTSAPPAAAVSSAPPPISGVSTGSTDLHVADTVPNTWTRVGLALERAQLGALSGRDENAHTYTLDFSATLATNAEGEHHWYTKVLHPFGGDSKTEQITRRLTVRVAEDAGGARVDVQGDGTDKETMDAARHVAKVLRERLT